MTMMMMWKQTCRAHHIDRLIQRRLTIHSISSHFRLNLHYVHHSETDMANYANSHCSPLVDFTRCRTSIQAQRKGLIVSSWWNFAPFSLAFHLSLLIIVVKQSAREVWEGAASTAIFTVRCHSTGFNSEASIDISRHCLSAFRAKVLGNFLISMSILWELCEVYMTSRESKRGGKALLWQRWKIH